jgi:hypothetical protein
MGIFQKEVVMKKTIFIIGLFFYAFLDGAERVIVSLSRKKDSPKSNNTKPKNLTGSDGAASSPKRPVGSFDELQNELQKAKNEKKQLAENK